MVRAIYEAGIATGLATFTTEAPSLQDWDTSHLALCRLVALAPDGAVLGWTALSPVSGRCFYAGVAEVSIYVLRGDRGAWRGRGPAAAGGASGRVGAARPLNAAGRCFSRERGQPGPAR